MTFTLASGLCSEVPEELQAISPRPAPQTWLARDQPAFPPGITPWHLPGAGWRSSPARGEGRKRGGKPADGDRRLLRGSRLGPDAPLPPPRPRGRPRRVAQRRPGFPPRGGGPSAAGNSGGTHRPPRRRGGRGESSGQGRHSSLWQPCERFTPAPVPSTCPGGSQDC